MAKIYRVRIESYDRETGKTEVIRDENEYYEGLMFYAKTEKDEENNQRVRGILMGLSTMDIASMIHDDEAFRNAYKVIRVVDKVRDLLEGPREEDGACLQ